MNLNKYLIKSTVVAALGGLLFGFDTAVIAGTTHALSETYRLSPGLLGLTVAIALWGAIVGAMTAGIPGERFGRRVPCFEQLPFACLQPATGMAQKACKVS